MIIDITKTMPTLINGFYVVYILEGRDTVCKLCWAKDEVRYLESRSNAPKRSAVRDTITAAKCDIFVQLL